MLLLSISPDQASRFPTTCNTYSLRDQTNKSQISVHIRSSTFKRLLTLPNSFKDIKAISELVLMGRLNSEKFQNFQSEALNNYFWWEITKMITRMKSRILKNSPYIWFLRFFNKMAIIGIASLQWKCKKMLIGWIRKNQRIHPRYHFCDFSSKMATLAWKFIFFLGIQPTYEPSETSTEYGKYGKVARLDIH